MHTWIEISKSALLNNVQALRGIATPAEFAPVIKSNAYGHGLETVFSILKADPPKWLCVAYLDEARSLREGGFKGHVLVVTPVFQSEFGEAAKLEAEILMTHPELLREWLAHKHKPVIHIKFDTGLSRQGFKPDDAEQIAEQVSPYRDRVSGVCTHFANVEDVLEHDYADRQLNLFDQARQVFRKRGFKLIEHCASSASSLILDKSRFDLCRVGISLYGLWPSPSTRLSYLQLNTDLADLQPVLSWKTTVAMVQNVKSGSFVGYGCSFRAVSDMRVAVLPVGYNEGYPRSAGEDRSYVLIRGERCPLVGRISMNLMTVDVSHLASLSCGEDVVLLGKSGSEEIDAAKLAGWANTIHYELVTRIHPSLPRIIVQ